MFRKAALRIVQDIGEPALPESSAKTVQPEAASSSVDAEAAGKDAAAEETVEKQDGNSTPASTASPSSTTTPDSSPASVTEDERTTTTSVRQPLEVPKDVHVRITAENLLDYVGPPLYQRDRLYTRTSPVGVSTGLGYLGNGSGAVMPIEVTVRLHFCTRSVSDAASDSSSFSQSMPGSGIQLTGKLGDVIKESAQIALAFLRAHAFELGLTDDKDKDLLEKRAIHLHMPEGSIGKEGPSAGIAIMTAFVSLFSKQGISSELGTSAKRSP